MPFSTRSPMRTVAVAGRQKVGNVRPTTQKSICS